MEASSNLLIFEMAYSTWAKYLEFSYLCFASLIVFAAHNYKFVITYAYIYVCPNI